MSSENKEADGTDNPRKSPAKKTVVFSLNVPPNNKNQDGSSKSAIPTEQSQSRDGNSSGSLLVRCFPVVFLGMFFLGFYTGSAMVKYLNSVLRSIFFQDRSYYTGHVENV